MCSSDLDDDDVAENSDDDGDDDDRDNIIDRANLLCDSAIDDNP
jgi:hypothetical protein